MKDSDKDQYADLADPFMKRRSVFQNLKAFYDAQLKVHPRVTNFCIAIVIASAANLVAQSVENSSLFATGGALAVVGGIDVSETQALALTTGIYNGFFLTPAFMTLGRYFPRSDLRSVLSKLAIAQFLFQPLVYVPYFFVFHGMLTGETFVSCIDQLTKGYFSTLFRMWALFMPSRACMFAFVPVNYQVLWDLCISFVWQFVLSVFNTGHHPLAATLPPALAGPLPLPPANLTVLTNDVHVHSHFMRSSHAFLHPGA